MERRIANHADYSPVSSTDKGNVAIQVEAAEIAPDVKRGQLFSNLTWEDKYYAELEDDIVAVFDIPTHDLQASALSKLCVAFFKLTVIAIILITLIKGDFGNFSETTVYWIFFSLMICYGFYLYFCVCVKAKIAMLVYSSQCHFALTTQYVRYDQSNPEIHTMIPIKNIISVTVAHSSFRRFGYFGLQGTISTVTMHLQGGSSKSYGGIQEAESFQKAIISLQSSNRNSDTTSQPSLAERNQDAGIQLV